MKTKTLLCALFALIFTGCMAVPKTEISFNPKTGTLKIQSPKNVSIGGATVIQQPTGFTLTVTNYSSTNDVSAITAVAKANAANLKAFASSAEAVLHDLVDAAK